MKIKSISTLWHNCDRMTFMTEDFEGQVEVQFPKEEPSVGYIWNLWVNEDFRCKGYATALLDEAERHIKERGCASAVLDWDKRDTPKGIYNWYKSRGYKEIEFNQYSSRLEKKIKPNKP